MRLQDLQVAWPNGPRADNLELAVLSEAAAHALRAQSPIVDNVQKIAVILGDMGHPNSSAILPGGVGVFYMPAPDRSLKASGSRSKEMVLAWLVEAFKRFITEASAREHLSEAIDQVFRAGPPYEVRLFRVKSSGETDLWLRYGFSCRHAVVDVVDDQGNTLGTLTEHDRFWPSDLLTTATNGVRERDQVILRDRRRREVARVRLTASSSSSV